MDSITKPFFAKDLIDELQDKGYKISFSSNLVENPDPREVSYYEQSSISINGDRFDLWKTSVLFIGELELLCFLKNSYSKTWHFEITIVNISSLQIVSFPAEFFYEHEVEIIGSSKGTFLLKLDNQLVKINVSDFPNVDAQRLEYNSIPTDQITPTRIEQISEPKAPTEKVPLEITPPCPYGFYEHDHGATIFFDLDLLDKSELFKLIHEIPGLHVTKSENLFQSFGPLESTDEYHSNQGSFVFNSTWEGMDTGHSISSENKTLIQQILKKLESSPHFVNHEKQQTVDTLKNDSEQRSHGLSNENENESINPNHIPNSNSSGCGSILVLIFFLCISGILLSTTVGFYKDLSIDLGEVKRYQGKVGHQSITRKSRIRGNSGFNLELMGLDHRFRFFHGDLSLLQKEIMTGEVITIYYSNYDYELYQIEKRGKILLDKRGFEDKQWVGVVMGTIFSLFSIWCTIFIFKRIQ